MSAILGLDLGKTTDPSAFVAAFQTMKPDPFNNGDLAGFYDVRNLHRWPLGTKYAKIGEDLKVACQNPALQNAVLVIDYTGVGKAVAEIFTMIGLPIPVYLVTITAGLKVVFDEKEGDWHVAKKELVSCLLRLFQCDRVRVTKQMIPTSEGDVDFTDLLVQEMNNFKLKITQAANETFGNWREGEHDDIVLALAICLWGGENLACGMFEPGLSPPSDFGKIPDDVWGKRNLNPGVGNVVYDAGNKWPW